MVEVGFFLLMTPTKYCVFTKIGKKFAETLQFKYFFYLHIFVKKVLNWYKMTFFYKCGIKD